MDRPLENMQNAGLIFVFSVWLQGQMSDLIIFNNHPELIADFVASPEKVPVAFGKIRFSYWEKQFGEVKAEFVEAFASDISPQESEELEEIFHVRNMIGHAHVSLGRDYMLYRPAGERKEKAVIAALKLKPIEDQSDPMMVLLQFWRPEVFNDISDKIGRLDQICFARLAAKIGVPHGRIR